MKTHERDRLEKVCRYIARPAVSEERLSTNDSGDVIYRFKKPWGRRHDRAKTNPDGTDGTFNSASSKKPRVHLTRYHGVLGPHYKHRKQIVPKSPELKIVIDDQVAIDHKQLEMKKKTL